MNVAVVGAGVFGATAALELRRRGHDVRILDPGPLPHPDAASTDISKLVRPDYGADALYQDWMLEVLSVWRTDPVFAPFFHETGLLVYGSSLERGTFEGNSMVALREAGVPLEEREGGYLNPWAGWAESGAVVDSVLRAAFVAGVVHEAREVAAVEDVEAEAIVVASGAWTPRLLPELGSLIRPIGQPVLHFRPDDPESFAAPGFPPWCLDIANTGFYGFPVTDDGVVKVANHGPGRLVDPTEPRTVDPAWDERFRAFLLEHLPRLAGAPIVGRRLCLYADSRDGDFVIDAVPDRPGTFVASGGSGHGFKFAPGLGALVADVVEGIGSERARRFAWRTVRDRRFEEARAEGS